MARWFLLMCSLMAATMLAIPARSVAADVPAADGSAAIAGDLNLCAFLLLQEAALEADLDVETALKHVILNAIQRNFWDYFTGAISYETYQANQIELGSELNSVQAQIDSTNAELANVGVQISTWC